MVLGESALVDVPEGRAALAQPDHDEDDGTPTQEDLEVRARLFRNYREAARRRELRLAKFTPQGWESPTLMEHRLARIKHAGIARMSRCKDTRRVSVAWIEPALGGFSGAAAKGLVLLREDVDLRAGRSSGVYPFAAISKHALRRFVSRSQIDTLDEVMKAAAYGLGWHHMAVARDVEGEYLVPHADGLFCNVSLREGLKDLSDPTGRVHRATLVKTWISGHILEEPLRSVHERLLSVTRGQAPFFPGFNDIHDWHEDAFWEMRLEGRERERIRLSGWGRPNDEEYAFWAPKVSDVELGRLPA